tara:strand:- start:812 stop:1126 length:315 start_codon:yes stop_codon:yes gene_type:complete
MTSFLDINLQSLLVILQFRGLGHDVFPHHEWGLDGAESLPGQESETVVDDGLVEEHSRTGEKITAGAEDVATGFEIDSSNHFEELEVRTKSISLVPERRETQEG